MEERKKRGIQVMEDMRMDQNGVKDNVKLTKLSKCADAVPK